MFFLHKKSWCNFIKFIQKGKDHEIKYELQLQWKLDLVDTDLAENLDLKDSLQKIWATIFDF